MEGAAGVSPFANMQPQSRAASHMMNLHRRPPVCVSIPLGGALGTTGQEPWRPWYAARVGKAVRVIVENAASIVEKRRSRGLAAFSARTGFLPERQPASPRQPGCTSRRPNRPWVRLFPPRIRLTARTNSSKAGSAAAEYDWRYRDRQIERQRCRSRTPSRRQGRRQHHASHARRASEPSPATAHPRRRSRRMPHGDETHCRATPRYAAVRRTNPSVPDPPLV